MIKQNLFTKAVAIIASLFLLSFSMTGYSQDVDNRYNINVGIVDYLFNSDKNQDDDFGYKLGFEFPLTEHLSGIVQHSEVDSDLDIGAGQTDVSLLHAGINYNFDMIREWQPYVGAGIGKYRFENLTTSGFDRESLDVNAGVKYFFNDNWMGKIEAMLVQPGGSLDKDFIIGASIGYVFGSRNSSPAAPRPTPVAATPEPVDSDGDGVFDNADACPNTPRGNSVDNRGCELDSDRDGIVDSRDACPNTRMGLAVDNNGCVILDEEQRRQSLAVLFDTNMSDIKDEYQNEIEDFAEFMREYNNTQATIEGHTDSDGAADYNQALSERRANAIRNELIMRYGISASRLTAVGYGESRPTASNSTTAGKAQNRRIEAAVSVMVETERMR